VLQEHAVSARSWDKLRYACVMALGESLRPQPTQRRAERRRSAGCLRASVAGALLRPN